jgi:TetR/AcrR family transcriptional repressor of nem operon
LGAESTFCLVSDKLISMKAKSTKGASTRQRIIEAAAKLMYLKGVNGTSVDDVLGASGTGKSQFYHYFASKESLVKELISFHLASLPTASEERLQRLGTLAGIDAWLDQILAQYHNGTYEAGCPIGNLASELSSQSEDLRLNLKSTFAHWEACLTQGLKQLKGQGVLQASVSPESLAMFCVAAIEGALLLAKTNKSAASLEATTVQLKAHIQALCVGASRRRVRSVPMSKFTFVP